MHFLVVDEDDDMRIAKERSYARLMRSRSIHWINRQDLPVRWNLFQRMSLFCSSVSQPNWPAGLLAR